MQFSTRVFVHFTSTKAISCRHGNSCLSNYWSGSRRVCRTQGRLNQRAHWARAQDPRIIFLFEGPPTGSGEIKIFKLIILLLMLLHDRTNTSKIDSKGLFLCCAEIVSDNGGINAANFLP